MSEKLIILSALVVLPLLPSYLLFKLLPSTGGVEGPMGGLKVKFSGAFGGYVALIVFLGWWINGPSYRVWNVGGSLQFENGGAPVPGSDVYCYLQGPNLKTQIDPGNSFNFSFPTNGDALPDLVFQAPGYEGRTIVFNNLNYGADDFGVKLDRDKGRVFFSKPIVLKKKAPTYQPTVAPVPVTGG